MVARDLAYRRSERKGRNRQSDKTIKNTVTMEELQEIADSIYEEQIKHKSENSQEHKKTMKEKYGGYVAKPLTKKREVQNTRTEKEDPTK